ncbi:hypothetical protein [uncultured Campylobacter sp.]|uniref:hypothetical protein n=1 Tax=uncultured Campylobacter sp. TaxID=218934 RepID=UPI0028EE382D|nr:hypothetical protein [uncultured Campylobacter sp.]
MKQMSETQQKAFEIYLDSATFETDYKPISEEQLAAKLDALGLKGSSSSINRWKKDFNWAQALQNKVTLAMSEDKQTRNLIQKSSLESAVKNTKVDLDRNNVLIAASYQILEKEARRIIEKQNEQGYVSKDDMEIVKFFSTLSTARHDKMLDRLALMPPEAVSAQQILSRLNEITIEVEGDVIDAEVQNEKASN